MSSTSSSAAVEPGQDRAPSARSAICVDGLSKRFGELAVLSDVSLSVDEGEVHVIVGPSGGGKSTFLRCLNGLERFDAGTVKVGDHTLDPSTDPRTHAASLESLRRKVGFVFQQFNLFPHLSVLENLTVAPIHVLGEPTERATARAKALLDRVGLASKLVARPAQLSGGQQQRAAIARCLMMKPDVILFDEPTSALDPLMAREVLAVMRDLAADGQTMIVVTHSMEFARRAATTVHLFADGARVESAGPDAFFDAPEAAATRAFLAKVTA